MTGASRSKTKKRKQRAHTKKRSHTKKHAKKKSKHTRKLKKMQCGPEGNKRGYTCIRDKSICKLKTLWNHRHPDDKIGNANIHTTWSSLKKRMGDVCDKESCWLTQQFSNDKMKSELRTAFAPEAPSDWKKNPNQWLSSRDITAVMKQYEKKYKCFTFIGPSPIDYDTHKRYGECVWEELCHFSLANEIKSGKKKIGVVFNLDPHYKQGSHWVSLFINLERGLIFYFDSVGDRAPAKIKQFAKDVTLQGSQLSGVNKPIKFKFEENHPFEHQYEDTECGIYSLFFIISLLEDTHKEEYFKTNRITDKCIERFRKIYFNEAL